MTDKATPQADANAPRVWWMATVDQNWTDWANGNDRGSVRGPVFTPHPVTALRGREQAGYGLVNLALGFKYPDGSEGWTDWITTNSGGSEKGPVRVADGTTANGIDVFEQAGYGLVDARLVYSGGDSDWLTGNNAQWLEELRIPDGRVVTGMEVREGSGYGIINLRLHYEVSS